MSQPARFIARIPPTSAARRACCQRRVLFNQPASIRQSQLFHSYDHPEGTKPFSETEQSLLSAAYKHVPEHGFTSRALSLGAQDAGFPDISPGVLADGPFSLVRYHLVTQREMLATRSKALFADGEGKDGNVQHLGIGAKVELVTWERLMGNKEIIHRWQEVLYTKLGLTRGVR
jgi:ubiquinone biosynthesis protein COQ9